MEGVVWDGHSVGVLKRLNGKAADEAPLHTVHQKSMKSPPRHLERVETAKTCGEIEKNYKCVI